MEWLGPLPPKAATTLPLLNKEIIACTKCPRLVDWREEFGVVKPLRNYEVVHPETNELLATAEAYWPDGLQPGIGSPVLLEFELEKKYFDDLNQLGMKVFENPKALLKYVRHEAQLSSGR
jgi:hypothetical protein